MGEILSIADAGERQKRGADWSRSHAVIAWPATARERNLAIAKAIRLLAPDDVAACRVRVETAFNIMAGAHQRDRYRRPTKKAMKDHDAALRQFRWKLRRAAEASVPLSRSIKATDREIALNAKWNKFGPSPLMRSLSPGWKPANRAHDLTAPQIAVELAYDLSLEYGQPTYRSRSSSWHQLAVILLGYGQDLRRQMDRVAQTRRRQT
jgi:hypothetical protein